MFDSMDYMDVIQLLTSGLTGEFQLKSTITGFSDNKYYVLEPERVLYIEVIQETLYAYTMDRVFTIKNTLQYYEKLWFKWGFLRINKSQVVNLTHVSEIIPWFNSRYVLKLSNKHEFEVSKLYAKALRHTLKI